VPLTADGMPETADDYRTWTFKVKPGIFFADDPAFKGAKRELVAADYVYAFKRFADPAVKSPLWASDRELARARPGRAAQAGAGEQEALRLRRARSKACALLDRYTFQFGWKSRARASSRAWP
jgi:ABC-type transport system substrate-binding protein